MSWINHERMRRRQHRERVAERSRQELRGAQRSARLLAPREGKSALFGLGYDWDMVWDEPGAEPGVPTMVGTPRT